MNARTRAAGRGAAVAAALLAVTLLAGCTAAGGGASAGSGRGAARSVTVPGGKAPTDRSVVTTGDLDLVSTNPVRAADAIAALVAGRGGHVQTLDEQPTGHPSADLTVRIPAAGFEATLASIERVGRVRTVSTRSTDVTSQVTDYGVRIANLRTSITRLQALLARAADTSAIVDIESSLTTRQTDLEQLLAEQKALADQVAFATLAVAVESPAAVPAAPPGTFGAGFVAGLTALARTVAVLAVVLGVILPWVVAAGVVALVAWWVLRLVRRRTRVAPGA